MYSYDRRKTSYQDQGYGLCPVCGKPGVTRCKCMIGDTTCPDGHTWHSHGDEVHLGAFPHDGTGDHADCEIVP